MNKEELSVGAIVGLIYLYFTGWYSLIAVPICAFLWVLGGTYLWDKNWRRLGVPILLCLSIALKQWSWLPLLSILPFHAVLRVGYGVPDGTDLGSDLGQFWTKKLTKLKKPYRAITLKQMRVVDTYVRGTVGLLIGLSMLPLAFINLPHYILSVILITIGIPFIVNVVE